MITNEQRTQLSLLAKRAMDTACTWGGIEDDSPHFDKCLAEFEKAEQDLFEFINQEL